MRRIIRRLESVIAVARASTSRFICRIVDGFVKVHGRKVRERERVCVFVRVRECVCERKRERVCVRESACVSERVREKE